MTVVWYQCGCVLSPDRAYVVGRRAGGDIALRPRTSPRLTVPGHELPLCPQQTSLSMGRPRRSAPLAVVLYAGGGGAVSGLGLWVGRVGSWVGAAPWNRVTFLGDD